MYDLDTRNSLIYSILSEKAKNPEISIDQTFSDFDRVLYHVHSLSDPKDVQLSMQIKCYNDLVKYGAKDKLQREYGNLIVKPENGYHVTLHLNTEKDLQDRSLIEKLSQLKRDVLAAPFEKAFELQRKLAGESDPQNYVQEHKPETMVINYRDEEAIYISASFDRVTVIFSTTFREETDKIFGKVFLQEFIDARRKPAIQNAPQVFFSYSDSPLEIRDICGKRADDVGFVTFVLFPRHFTKGNADNCISRIQVFRNTLHYHIKGSKAFMHQRMRKRVQVFLKVLNRAKMEKPDREKKTSSGRTFKLAS